MNGLNTINRQNAIASSNLIEANGVLYQTRLNVNTNRISILSNNKQVLEESLEKYIGFDGGVSDYIRNRVATL